jgi:hypothetical protein
MTSPSHAPLQSKKRELSAADDHERGASTPASSTRACFLCAPVSPVETCYRTPFPTLALRPATSQELAA